MVLLLVKAPNSDITLKFFTVLNSELTCTVQVRRLTRTDSEEEAEFYLRVLNYPHLLQAASAAILTSISIL